MDIRRTLKRTTIVISGLAALQVGLWLLVGLWSLPRQIPRMIELDIEAAREYFAQKGEDIPENPNPETYVVCEKLADRLGPGGVARLRDLLKDRNLKVIPESAAPPGWKTESGTTRGFAKYCYEVEFTSPIYARINYYYWHGGLAAGGTVRSAWFVLGFWMPGEPVSVWVS